MFGHRDIGFPLTYCKDEIFDAVIRKAVLIVGALNTLESYFEFFLSAAAESLQVLLLTRYCLVC